mmetsp:Transcript_20091/g.49357  ORF Transcript_20091/g.49357 Transcript_20091/m.49357 type:complete len:615 (-) Transcript_20091:3-1847(-)
MSGYTMAELGLSFEGLDLEPGIPYYMEHVGEINFWVPLYQALLDRDLARVQLLVEMGADVEGRIPGNPAPNDYGSALHIAAMYCPEAIDLLLDAGADINSKRPSDGFNVLMTAAQCNNLQSAKQVLSKEKELFFGTAGFFQSPIAVAEYYDSFDVLRWLLQVEERYKAGTDNWWNDAGDAAHVAALRAAQAEAEARRLAELADAQAKAAADAEARKKAEDEAAAQRKKAEEEALAKKKAQEEALRLAAEAEDARRKLMEAEEAARKAKEDEAKRALEVAEAAAAAAQDEAAKKKAAEEAEEAKRRIEEERMLREAAEAEAAARKKAAEEAERKRKERAAREAERKKLLAESMRKIREAEDAARAAADDEARKAAEKLAQEMRKKAEQEAAAKAAPSRGGLMSKVHRLLAQLEDKNETVRNKTARELKEIVALKGEAREYVQEALVNLCRPNLASDDASKKNAVEWLIKMVDSKEDCVVCIRIGGIPALIALVACLKSSGGIEQARVSAWRILKKVLGGGLPAEWTKYVASELCTLVVEGVRSVCGYSSTNIKREREQSALCLEILTKHEPASHELVKAHEGAVRAMKGMSVDPRPSGEQGRDSSRRVLNTLKML